MFLKFFIITFFSLSLYGLPVTSADMGHAPDSSANLPNGIIGVALHISAHRVGDPASLYIRAIHPEGPAARAGLAHGDEVLQVDGTVLSGKTYQEVVAMIRGEVGKSVTLQVKGEQGLRDVSISRISENTLMDHPKT
ncbi:PDZ domain-containing protein [Nitrospira sp. M1]